MRKKIVILSMVILTLLLITISSKPTESRPPYTQQEIIEMVRDIQSLNLLNSLHLTQTQMKELLSVAQEVKRMDDKQKALHDRKYNSMYKILSEMRTQLMSSNDLSRDLKHRYHNEQREIKENRADYDDRIKELEVKVKTILNENQLVMLKEYQPCLVPVKSISNPERIGQAGGGERFIKLLEHARRVPPERYSEFKQHVLTKTKEKIRLHVREDEERKRVVQNISSAMDKARNMSDTDFEINKQELADSMVPQHKNKGNVEKRFIKQFLLNPGLVAILQQKMRTASR